MLCDECGKRPANVHLTRVVNGEKSERHLCGVCARENGEFGLFTPGAPGTEPSSAFQQMLGALLEGTPGGLRTAGRQGRCEECGMPWSEVARTGFLGCSACYRTFQTRLQPVVRRIHGATRHAGKRPARRGPVIDTEQELRALRKALAEAVEQEAFERAAELRDRIRELERQLS